MVLILNLGLYQFGCGILQARIFFQIDQLEIGKINPVLSNGRTGNKQDDNAKQEDLNTFHNDDFWWNYVLWLV